MAITYPLNWPDYSGVANITFRQHVVAKYTESPVTLIGQTLVHTGARFSADVSLPPLSGADARKWVAWLTSLRGREGQFLMPDPLNGTPRGSIGGTPLISGADQTGNSVNLDGATPSVTGWLLAGDWAQINTGADTTFHMVLQDADSDGSGNVTLELFPSLRTAHPDNTPVTVSDAHGLWRLSDAGATWDVSSASIFGIQFSCDQVVQ